MKRFKKFAMRNTLAACIYFAGMMIAASAPLITLYITLYAVSCR